MTPDLSKEPCSNNTYSWFPDGHTLSHSHAQITPQHSIYWLTAYCYFRHVTPPNSCRLLRFRCVVVFQPPSRQINRKADGLERSQLRVWGSEVAFCVNSTVECVRILYISLTFWANTDRSQKCSLSSNRSCKPAYLQMLRSFATKRCFSSQTSLSRPHCWT